MSQYCINYSPSATCTHAEAQRQEDPVTDVEETEERVEALHQERIIIIRDCLQYETLGFRLFLHLKCSYCQ